MGTIRLFKVWLIIALMVLSGGSLAFADDNHLPSSGNVGIGTTDPTAPLDVHGNIVTRRPSGNDGLSIYNTSVTGTKGWTFYPMTDGTNTDLRLYEYATSGSDDRLTIKSSGNVGIGTTNPLGKFQTKVGTNLNFYLDTASGFVYMAAINDSGNDNANLRIEGAKIALMGGNVGIGTTSPTSKLHVAGDGKITGDLTVDGNIAAKYQDVAEWVRTPVPLKPGTVVVIDPLESNRVLPSSQSYDTRIAGVVSSQPGIILGEAGEDKTKVAHSGRVKVKVDAQFGPISVGDLLVSSATTGYAMRSTPIEMNGIFIHRPGTIVGKALEPLKEGEGEILVLLTLQ